MKAFKWIVSIVVIVYFYNFYSSFVSENRYKKRTSMEVNNMIQTIEDTNSSTYILTLWHYYLVRDEKDNLYQMVCFMKQHLNDEKLYKNRVNNYMKNKNLKLEKCSSNPMSLIHDYNTIWDNIIAWSLTIKDSSLHLTKGDGVVNKL